MTAGTDLTVAIGVLTFRRPMELAHCLTLVAEHVAATAPDGAGLRARSLIVTLLVVDNDPAGSARATVEAVRAIVEPAVRLQYVIEPTPGIAAARNRALDETADADVLVFIDDDEWPTESWLAPLLSEWERSGATAVMGRVVSRFASTPDPWVEAGEFFRRRSLPTGTDIQVAAAGNMLLDRVEVARLGVRFDEALALGAGEDSLFSRQLVRGGGRIAWCEESVVIDRVPNDRMTRRWVLDRARSHGNTETVVALRMSEGPSERARVRLTALGRGAARAVAGTGRFGFGLASRSLRHQARGLRTAYRGVGIASGALGVAVQEYAREDSHARA